MVLLLIIDQVFVLKQLLVKSLGVVSFWINISDCIWAIFALNFSWWRVPRQEFTEFCKHHLIRLLDFVFIKLLKWGARWIGLRRFETSMRRFEGLYDKVLCVCVCCFEVDLEAHLSGYQNQVRLWLNFWSGLPSLFLGSRFSRQKKQKTMMNDKITWKTLVHKVCRLCLSGDWSSLSEVNEAFVSCKLPGTYLDCSRIGMYVGTLWHVLPHHV
jgi:hypothetical protein